MCPVKETSDVAVLDLMRQGGPVGIAKLSGALGVTATAVRQRLNRLMGRGLVDRHVERTGRGRPSHRYALTEKGRLQTGMNFVDLSIALWKEIRAIADPEVRRGLFGRIASHMAAMYRPQVGGATPAERMQGVSRLFAERDVPFVVEGDERLPVLTALACPYPQLAEQDRGVCAMERMMLSELIGTDVRLSECRLDGDACCRFETN